MSYVNLTGIIGSGSARGRWLRDRSRSRLYDNKERSAMAHGKPFDFDIHHPDFRQQMLAWAFRVQCDMQETVLTTKETIAATQAMIAEADRVLVRI